MPDGEQFRGSPAKRGSAAASRSNTPTQPGACWRSPTRTSPRLTRTRSESSKRAVSKRSASRQGFAAEPIHASAVLRPARSLQLRSKAGTLAEALREFVMIERHAELGQWKAARQPSPERRVLAATPCSRAISKRTELRASAEQNRTKLACFQRQEQRAGSGWQEGHPEGAEVGPEGPQAPLPRVEPIGGDRLKSLVSNSTVRDDSYVVISKRWTVDSRQAAHGARTVRADRSPIDCTASPPRSRASRRATTRRDRLVRGCDHAAIGVSG